MCTSIYVCVCIGVLPIGVGDEDGEGDGDIVCDDDGVVDEGDITVVDVEVIVDGVTRKYIKLIIVIIILNILPDNVIDAEKFRPPIGTSNKYIPASAVVRFVNVTLDT